MILILAALLILSSAQLGKLHDGDVVTFYNIKTMNTGGCAPQNITFYYYSDSNSTSTWSFPASEACMNYGINGSLIGGSIQSDSNKTISSQVIQGYNTSINLFSSLNLEGWIEYNSISSCNFWTNNYTRSNINGYSDVYITVYNNLPNIACCAPYNLTIDYQPYYEGYSYAYLYWYFPDTEACENSGINGGNFWTEAQIYSSSGYIQFYEDFGDSIQFSGTLYTYYDQLSGQVYTNSDDCSCSCSWSMVPYYVPQSPYHNIPGNIDVNITLGKTTIFTADLVADLNYSFFPGSYSGAGRLISGAVVSVGLGLAVLVFS